jgi:hypothetical protein
MRRKIFLDIETLPPDEEMRPVVEQDVRFANTADEPKADAEMSDTVERQFRELSLRAERGRLLTIGVLVEEDGHVTHHGLLGRDRVMGQFHLDEARTLGNFWRLIKDFNPCRDLFIGHNVLDFDLPFLIKRSVIHRVKPSVNICFRRFQQQPVFDTMWEWSCWRHRIGLHDLAVALGITSSKQGEIDGSGIYDAFRDGRHSDIALYCMQDVECTRDIYYRLKFLEPPHLERYGTKMAMSQAGADIIVGDMGLPVNLTVA